MTEQKKRKVIFEVSSDELTMRAFILVLEIAIIRGDVKDSDKFSEVIIKIRDSVPEEET